MRHRSWSIVLLAGFFAWKCLRSLEALFLYVTNARFRAASDSFDVSAAPILWLFVAVLMGVTAISVWMRSPTARVLSSAMLILLAVTAALELSEVRADPATASKYYAEYRRSRGLALAAGRVDQLFSPTSLRVMPVAAGALLAIPALLLLAAWRQLGPGPGRRVLRYESEPFRPDDGQVAKVRVYRDGRVSLDGESISLAALESAFARLKTKAGAIWYYRETGDNEPHANAMEVMRAVVAARLPISVSSEEDFSNVVLPDGTRKKREWIPSGHELIAGDDVSSSSSS